MKYCSKCGKELFDEAVICVGCGCPVPVQTQQNNPQQARAAQTKQIVEQEENSNLATIALILAFLVPIGGVVTGIIGLTKYKDSGLKTRCGVAIALSIFAWAVYFVILMGLMGF